MPTRRAVAVVAVLLLHLGLLWLLMRATLVSVSPPPIFREEPITLWLQTAPKPKPPIPKPEEKTKKEGPAPVTRAIGPPAPAPTGAPPASDYNGLRALGRYLNNCSGGNYGMLSEREWAHCLGNRWQTPGEPPAGLGLEPPSEWKAQMDKRRAPAKPIERQCAQGTLNSNLGLPCYDFGK